MIRLQKVGDYIRIWQKLEDENGEFFKAYHVRLMLKNQITIFNQLIQKQVELMHGVHPARDASVCLHVQQTPSCYTSTPRPDNVPFPLGPSSTLLNGAEPPSFHSTAITDATSLREERVDLPMSLLPCQSPQITMLHGMNGTTIKMEPTYSSNSEFTFCTVTSYSEGRPATGDAPLPSFSGTDLNGGTLNESMLDIDASSYGILSQIPGNFSFSDLTQDFTQSTEILEGYGRSPFLGPESNLSTSTGRECEGERKI
ncbi:hypothetical protein Taro_031466 [Colocasia esculenta]|uniref:Uncharacterized protein n=1 Tax=Colocasia esculenta TaxID=4460 RepID=A0A843VIW5_COLES|nr:hypothetical protein [Colocasia esculenta]